MAIFDLIVTPSDADNLQNRPRTGSTSTVTNQMNLPTFTLAEIRTPAKCGSHQSHFLLVLALRQGNFERLNGWSA